MAEEEKLQKQLEEYEKLGVDMLYKKMPESDNSVERSKLNKSFHDDAIESIYKSSGIYRRSSIEFYNRLKRFGCIQNNPVGSNSKEYLFFTKPDLHIFSANTSTLNPELSSQPYFVELEKQYPRVAAQLQMSNGISNGNESPFMNILSNSVKNTLELPAVTTSVVDTPATIYGTAYNYRGWGYSSDEKLEFSLEFEDTKYLEIYHLVKAYEEYERLKHLGMVTPPNIDNAPVVNGKCFSYYIKNKILHDQFSIYKFIVDDDGETIIYYAKLWGVFFKNVPRDAFSDMKTDGGLTYALDFEAAFVDDMNPTILTDFNELVYPYIQNGYTQILPIFDKNIHTVNNDWAKIPVVSKVDIPLLWDNVPKGMKYTYKLKWVV